MEGSQQRTSTAVTSITANTEAMTTLANTKSQYVKYVYLISSNVRNGEPVVAAAAAAGSEPEPDAPKRKKTSGKKGIGRAARNIQTKIGVASNLAERLDKNNRILPGASRRTKGGAGGWVYELVLGPFASGANALAKEWISGTRGLVSKYKRGLQLGEREEKRHGGNVTLRWAGTNGNMRRFMFEPTAGDAEKGGVGE